MNIEWNRVTWYSKVLAALFFLIFLPLWVYHVSLFWADTNADIEYAVRAVDVAWPNTAYLDGMGETMASSTMSIKKKPGQTLNQTPSQNPASTPAPTSTQTPAPTASQYQLHTGITATVFWVGEPVGNGSSEDNALSAWDDHWQKSYGGYDDYVNRNGYFPAGFTPKENPFYLDVPYSDFTDSGKRRSNAYDVIPWAHEKNWGSEESMMKNRWVKMTRNGTVCYGQIEDAGPYEYNDVAYVFGASRPKSQEANNAGMDVSPALRDCLKFQGLNNDSNKVDWQFVDAEDVPAGPWKQIVTTSQINWN